MSNDNIALNFGNNIENYDMYADVQKKISIKLADLLPAIKNPKILEIGCGTGFLTQLLFQKYPSGNFDITDLSPDMVNYCQENYFHDNARYFVMNGENPKCDDNYDLIVSSMTFQWFQNPKEALKKLSKKGSVYFSTLGQDNFKEWKTALKQQNLIDRTLCIITWPHIVGEEIIEKDYQNGLRFLKTLKLTGAATSLSKKKNRNYSAFKHALSTFDGQVSWHIIYGIEPCQNTIISA